MSTSAVLGRPAGFGTGAFAALLAIYFGLLTLISGWSFTLEEFTRYWYYLVPLAAGFGLQVALFLRLREVVSRARQAGAVIAASGTTSTAAMISCCAHYLANVAPVLGATGLVALAAQFQVEFYWVGLAFNAAGIAYVGSKLYRASQEHAQCTKLSRPSRPSRGESAQPGGISISRVKGEIPMIEFAVEGMTCNHCVKAVTKAVQEVDPGAHVSVDLQSGKVRVEGKGSADVLSRAIGEAGYKASATA